MLLSPSLKTRKRGFVVIRLTLRDMDTVCSFFNLKLSFLLVKNTDMMIRVVANQLSIKEETLVKRLNRNKKNLQWHIYLLP